MNIEMQDQHLYESLRNLSKEIINWLRQNASNQEKNRHGFDTLLASYEQKIFQLPSVNEKLQEFCKIPIISKYVGQMVGTQWTGVRITPENIIKAFLVNLCLELDDMNFDDKTFRKTYEDMEKQLYSETVTFCMMGLLENFEGDFQEIPIEKDLKIVRIDTNELKKVSDEIHFFDIGRRGDLLNTQFAIEFQYQERKVFSDTTFGVDEEEKWPRRNWLDIQSKIWDVLTCLQLFKHGGVKITYTKNHPLSDLLPIGGTLWGRSYPHPPALERYVFASAEVAFFVKLYNDFKAAQQVGMPNYLMVAIDRYKFAYDRFHAEDAIIDCMVAFEALFLKGDEQQELSYRLSLRSAFFLGENSEKRMEVFNFIRDAYKARNKIVHGERATGKATDKEFVTQAEEYLRLSIQKILKETLYKQEHEDFIKSLDDLILNHGTQQIPAEGVRAG